MKDRFGNKPYVLTHSRGRTMAWTEEAAKEAVRVARICRCGTCDCCTVAEYMKENNAISPRTVV